MKSPCLAVILSFFMAGLGHFYIGKVGKGFIFLVLTLFMWMFGLGWVIGIICMISAYSDAKDYNQKEEMQRRLKEAEMN